MLIYWIILGILFVGGIYDVVGRDKKIKKRAYVGALILLGIFFGTRGFIGWDWYHYYPSFMEEKYIYEPGYMALSRFIGRIYKNYNFFVFINSAIDFVAIYFIFKRWSKYPILTLALYFGVQGIPMEVDLMRNIKSILLFLFSLEYIERRKPIPFILLNGLGILFHGSSAIYLPMYFILNRKWDKRFILGLFILGNIYYLLNPKFIIGGFELLGRGLGGSWEDKILGYLSVVPRELENEVTFFYLERIVLFVFAFTVSKNEIIKNSVYVWIFIFLFTSEISIASVRIGILFVYSCWFLLSEIPSVVNTRIEKEIGVALAISIALFRFYNHVSFPGNQMVYPYENIFIGKNGSYEERSQILIEARKTVGDAHGKELLLQY